MRFTAQLKLSCLFLAMVLLSGCDFLFENFKDVQARQALHDLMAIQDQYYRENSRFARNLMEIEKYNLKYHSGIVYLEIEQADKEAYRAIALPAESDTARVFAFDTSKGGFYEMGEEEVSTYVLGALNYIREKQTEKRITDYMSLAIVLICVVIGIRVLQKNRVPHSPLIFTPFFLTLAPMGLSMAILNHMDQEIVFSPLLQGCIGAGVACGLAALGLAYPAYTRIPENDVKSNLTTVVVVSGVLSICSAAILIYTFMTYFGTTPNSPNFIIPGQG